MNHCPYEMIIVNNLTKTYGKITALNKVNFNFDNSHVIAIMGENGAGKTTLLKICTGILPFDNGEITIDGYNIKKDSIKAREQIGYLPEMPDMYDRLTGREFLFYIGSLRKLNDAENRINEITKMIGIYDFLDYEVGSYSKGMKQKISMTSAIMHNPTNLLLDEPVYGLDPLTSKAIRDFIENKKGTTVIATHSTQLVEQIADLVYILMRGNVIHFEEVSKLVSKHGSIEEAYFHIKDENNV
jgi:ABC-type multidrug transport system ATPase subunit